MIFLVQKIPIWVPKIWKFGPESGNCFLNMGFFLPKKVKILRNLAKNWHCPNSANFLNSWPPGYVIFQTFFAKETWIFQDVFIFILSQLWRHLLSRYDKSTANHTTIPFGSTVGVRDGDEWSDGVNIGVLASGDPSGTIQLGGVV